MVRFENLLYEKLVNIKLFNRARQFGPPRKWYNESREEGMQVMADKVLNKSVFGMIYRLFEPLLAKVTYQWTRDILLQRGLAHEDIMVFKERDLRRDYFFETVARQNLHPYQILFFNKRRSRYYKVERALRGCYVPEFIRQEAESRLLSDTAANRYEWRSFIYENYVSDMTPSTRGSIIPRLIPLEFLIQIKIFNLDAWERYFYNEVNYTSHDPKEHKALETEFKNSIQLNDNTARRNFEDKINNFIRLYPGAIVKEGEKFDFDQFYAGIKADREKPVVQENKWDKLRLDLKVQVDEHKVKKKKTSNIIPSSFGRSLRKSLLLN